MNTVSIRIKGNSTSKAVNQLAHDMRIKKVDYLKNENQKNILKTVFSIIIDCIKNKKYYISIQLNGGIAQLVRARDS